MNDFLNLAKFILIVLTILGCFSFGMLAITTYTTFDDFAAFVFGLLGLPLLWGGIVITYKNIKFLLISSTINGIVTSIISYENSKGTRLSRPVINFQVNEKEYQIEANTSSSPATYSIGNKVKVHYLKAAPQQAQLAAFTDLWMKSFTLFTVGGAFISISIFTLLNNLG